LLKAALAAIVAVAGVIVAALKVEYST